MSGGVEARARRRDQANDDDGYSMANAKIDDPMDEACEHTLGAIAAARRTRQEEPDRTTRSPITPVASRLLRHHWVREEVFDWRGDLASFPLL
jgi:hypothetical protein